MKRLEIIRRILEEDPTKDVFRLLSNDTIDNLSTLCYINKKYLTEENINNIINKIQVENVISYSQEFNSHPINSYGIGLLIGKYPKLLHTLSKQIIKNFYSYNWADIISEEPSLIEECDILDEFDLKDWFTILKRQPQLASEYKDIYASFKIRSTPNLTSLIPILSKYIDVNKIHVDADIFSDILNNYPEIVKSLDKYKLDLVPIKNWLNIMSHDPELLSFCPIIDKINKVLLDNDNIEFLIRLVSKQPSFSNLLPSIDKISRYNIIDLVRNKPELIEKLNINIEQFDRDDWCKILKLQPQLINRCNKIDKFSDYEWSNILYDQPKLIKYCNRQLNSKDIQSLLNIYPNLINNVNTNVITESEFEYIVYNSKDYNVKIIEKYTERFHNSEVLTNMIGIYPNLKDFYSEKDLWKYVDFSKLTENLEYVILK